MIKQLLKNIKCRMASVLTKLIMVTVEAKKEE